MTDHLASPALPAGAGLPYSRPASPGLPRQIGFVGLGAMGYHMAHNLAAHKHTKHPSHAVHPLLVWNRNKDKSKALFNQLGQDKIRVADSLAEIALECDIIFTSLATDEVVKWAFEQMTSALKDSSSTKHRIFVETSTIYPTLAGELDQLVSAIPHARLITCPVIGPPAVAKKGQLVIMMSGDYRSKKEIAYLIVPAVGRKVIDLGENLEKAPTCKLIGNSMIISSLEILGEAYTLGEKSGIGADNVRRLVQEIFPAPGTLAYSERMYEDNFDGSSGFAIDGGIKDASHIRRLTAQHNAPMPCIDIAHQHLITARALHLSLKSEGKEVVDTLDWSGIVAGSRVAAGLDAFDSAKHTRVVRED
ncbi:NAD-P-binding protein [Hymenopellis radicata]|nr:NAD-P-binding protein [Hymenopellis radicata]